MRDAVELMRHSATQPYHRPMPRMPAAALLLGAAAAGCSPTFNWRDVRTEPSGLKAMLPCKPEKSWRRVPMAGREVELHVTGCDAGGATYAVFQADIGDPALASDTLDRWNRATLSNLKATASRAEPFLPPGAVALPASQRTSAAGQRADGSPVQGEAAYFARGSQVFQAVVYAGSLKPEWTQPFFQGLRFE